MARTTRKQVHSFFVHFVEAIGGRVATSHNDAGAYTLDYSPYGGYMVVQLHANGAQRTPFGEMRRKPAEMWDAMHFAMRALEAAQENGGQS